MRPAHFTALMLFWISGWLGNWPIALEIKVAS